MSDVADAGYDEWLDAAAEGRAYYLECSNGHGSLPPRRVCPDCGSADLAETPLARTGEVETYTVTHVPTPAFEEDAPYATAVAAFGSVRVTGQIVGIDLDSVEPGLPVALTVTVSETDGERLVAFEPA